MLGVHKQAARTADNEETDIRAGQNIAQVLERSAVLIERILRPCAESVDDSVKALQIGAQKGILISTSDFQSGAIEFAKAHGIALIKAEDYHFEFLSHASGQPENDDDPFLYAENHMPSYVGFDFTADSDEQRKVFPTKAMIKELLDEMNKRICELMEIDMSIEYPNK